MNFLKNIMILAVLAAVGYGVYVSLSRNNVDGGPAPGVADAWPTPPKVDVASTKPTSTLGGPLPISGTPSVPQLPSTMATPTPVAPTLSIPGASLTPPGTSTGIASSGSTANTSPAAVTPYPSGDASAPPATPQLTVPSLSPPTSTNTPGLSSSPAIPAPPANATMPTAPPDLMSPSNTTGVAGVHNLNPPPDVNTATSAVAEMPTQVEKQWQNRFNSLLDDVQKYLDNGKLAEAHLALSLFYNDPRLPADQAKQVAGVLGQLAGSVIYSRRHLLEPAYVTQPGDTLEKVALRYSIPWQLIAKINGLVPPNTPNTDESAKDQPLPANMQLKVLRGPFDAVVHLGKHEITLVLQERYAGHYSIGLGRDQTRLEGEYTVMQKILNPPYRGPDGIDVRPNDPKNPLGGAWIGLSDRVGIHGTNDRRGIGRDDNPGVICVSESDIQELYGILSIGSRVKIVR